MFESAALISPSAILDFHSQHSVHSAPGSRMVGMVFYTFRNRNAAYKDAHIFHSGHSHSRIVDKKTRPYFRRCKLGLDNRFRHFAFPI